MSTLKSAQAVRFHEAGGPEVLKIENVEIPAPAAHEVRIAVKAIGLNRVDSLFRMGVFSDKPVFPSQIGFEAAGIVESVGSAVTNVKIGDKVSVVPAFSNHDYGTYGELILVPGYALQKYPEALSFEEAASIWTSFIAVYGMLIDGAGLKPGQVVIINAASSNTGLAAIQTVNVAGGISIALTSSPLKAKAIAEAGAQHVIITSEEDVVSRIMEITGGKGADIILDAVGGSQFEKLVKSAAERAIIFAYGVLSFEPAVYPAMDVLLKMISIQGYNMGDLLMNPEKNQAAIAFVQQGLKSGGLKPVVGKSFPLHEVAESHRYLEANQHIGKVVLSV